MSLIPGVGIFSHKKYEDMGVDEILDEFLTCKGCPIDSPLLKELTERSEKLVILLRSAVIRESSVGEISIEQHEGYVSPDPLFTVGAKSTLKAGEFYLVPKEKE